MILFFSLYVIPKQDYLHSIHLHYFPFLYFKTFKQGYLIRFHSIQFDSFLFHSFHSLKYIPFYFISFHSFPFLYDHYTPFHFIHFWTPKQSLKATRASKQNEKRKQKMTVLFLCWRRISPICFWNVPISMWRSAILVLILLGSKELETNVLELHFVLLVNHDQNILVLFRFAQSVFICKVGIECSAGFTV